MYVYIYIYIIVHVYIKYMYIHIYIYICIASAEGADLPGMSSDPPSRSRLWILRPLGSQHVDWPDNKRRRQ